MLKEIAANGADAFYTGRIAEDIVATVREAVLNPGRMTVADIAGYKAVKRKPVCGAYRGYRICGMPPPSSGGVTVAQILGILGSFDLAAAGPGSTEAAHLVAEAGRLAFADRNLYLADTDFVPAPLKGLLDPAYLAQRAKLISREKSMGKASAGQPPRDHGALTPMTDDFERLSTTHLSVVDDAGNAV